MAGCKKENNTRSTGLQVDTSLVAHFILRFLQLHEPARLVWDQLGALSCRRVDHGGLHEASRNHFALFGQTFSNRCIGSLPRGFAWPSGKSCPKLVPATTASTSAYWVPFCQKCARFLKMGELGKRMFCSRTQTTQNRHNINTPKTTTHASEPNIPFACFVFDRRC